MTRRKIELSRYLDLPPLQKTPLTRLIDGELVHYDCPCGRQCPMRYRAESRTVEVDHGGEAVWSVTVAELVASPTHSLESVGFAAWRDRCHAYEHANHRDEINQVLVEHFIGKFERKP